MIDVRENVPLAPFTTLDVGGPARFFVTVRDQNELIEAVRFADEQAVPIFVFVGGSNVVISDNGFPGCVIQMQMKGIDVRHDGDDVLVRAGAGEVWDTLVAFCVERGWSGLESLSGIPGSVGAAPVQNIGAYGASVNTFIDEVEIFDRNDKTIRLFRAPDCRFSYRDSIFRHPQGSTYIITHVTLRLSRSSVVDVPPYHDLRARFAGQTEVSSAELRRAILDIRAQKGMVILPGYETVKSVGSFFKNPVISPEQFISTEKVLVDHPDGACTPPWYWAQSDGRIKVAAACLLECAGFSKGYREGNVGISPKHALALMNYGGATASEVVAFAQKIQNTVSETFGVILETEAQYVGFDS